jgi:hypothetical protein
MFYYDYILLSIYFSLGWKYNDWRSSIFTW